MASPDESTPALRLTLLMVVVFVLFAALVSRLWFLQVLAGERYAQLAESNRVRLVVLDAPRGQILAADGQPLVKNRPAQTISAHPRELINLATGKPKDAEAAQVLHNLSVILDMPEDDIITRLTSRKYSPFKPVPIKEDVSPEVIFHVSENQEHYQGVVAETLPVRTYPQGTLAAHMVGYLSEISEKQLQEPAYTDYRPGDLVGQSGLEKTYESDLRGTEGRRVLEVNARGTVLKVLSQKDPERGNDLVTNIDLHLQTQVESLLKDGILASRNITRSDGRKLPSVAGSAVVLDPRTGAVKAMASYPTYDPSLFVGGISQKDYDALVSVDNELPIYNRAVQSAYPPGSVFKPISGSAYMAAGVIGPSTPVGCPSVWSLGGIAFHNWNRYNEGNLTISSALKRSCDTFFYQAAYQEWLREQHRLDNGETADEILPKVARDFGLGRRLGIDLPVEATGHIPSREARKQYWEKHKDGYCAKADAATDGSYAKALYTDLCKYGGNWRGGDAVNSSIGQGDVLTTPLQIASAYVAIANGGTLYRPHIGKEIRKPDGTVVRTIAPEVLDHLPDTPEQLAAIQKGVQEVVMDPRGTGHYAFTGFPLDQIPVAGKTGTAEMKPKVPYAWFASYAPANDPKYVVVVSVEQGGGGSQTAAPIARRILEAAFGLKVSPFQAGPGNVD